MAGQGITVSIQAKIEGWQEQIKQIQNAMKNIKPGSDISKGLMKDLQQVESLVNNLGKNMTQRFTSDSQITHFMDKMMDVERVFDRIGGAMQNISFGDLNPDYITNNFKDLLSTLEQANIALGEGMQSSFQNAIAESKNLQKEFDKMKLDPKDMNIDQIKEALSNRGQSLAKELQQAQAETDKLKKKMDDARFARDELQNRKSFIGTDSNAKAMELLGGNIPVNGTILDQKEIDNKLENIRSSFVKMGFSEAELGRILPSVDKLMQAAQWDQIPQKLERYIRDAAIKTSNSLDFANNRFDQAKTDYQSGLGAQMKVAASVYGNNAAQQDINGIVAQKVEEATRALREEVTQLKAQLEGKATQQFHGLGGSTRQSSAQGLQDAAVAAKNYSAELERVKAGEAMLGKVQGVVQRWFSVYAVVRMVGNAIRKAAQTIQELDSTMTEISIVTKMSQSDLWKQMPKYTKMARDYASSIKGVYEVSQIYYQQGLEMNEVMDLTESTLKMARISGLGYSEAADYMTNAVRSFKMEMSDAQRVVDVYSAVAASSASNVTELATAMSKTASSAQAVGSSFENTTAMLAVMIEATRESPENIGSAMKSIISRYGELKENKTGIDEEGEEYSLNKVDTALQSVGISIHDAKGEFRDFDDVIMELSEHWNEIDKNTQRYIATIMAGNRQQSRFLALVSSSDRLQEEREKAANSEDAAQLQFLKSLDSIDAKKQQLETSIQSIYTNSGIENLYKGLLDFSNNILITFDNLSGESGLGAAVAKIGATFMTLATLVTHAFTLVKQRLAMSNAELTAQIKADALAQQMGYESAAEARTALNNETIAKLKTSEQEYTEFLKAENDHRLQQDMKKQQAKRGLKTGAAMAASMAGLALTTTAANLDVNKDREKKAALTGLGGILSGVGTGFMIGGVAGGIIGTLTAIPSIIEAIGMATESTAEKINRLETNITETNNERIKSKDDLKTLVEYKSKYKELSKVQYESAEKQKEFKDLQNEIAEKYPSLIQSMDSEGNYIVDMADAYTQLVDAKRELYSEKFAENLGAELAGLKDIDYVLKSIYGVEPQKAKTWLGFNLDGMDQANQNFLKSFEAMSRFEGMTVPRINTGAQDEYGRTIYEYDPGFMSFNNRGLASMFLDDDATVVTQQDTAEIAKYLLAGVYNEYIKNAKEGKAFENINIDKEGLMQSAREVYGASPYSEIYSNTAVYEEILEQATTNFSPEQYKSMVATNKANTFANELRRNAIQTSNADYIKTLNASVEDILENPVNNLQQFAIKKTLDKELDEYLIEHENDTYKDKNNREQKYTPEELVKKFYEDKSAEWYSEEINKSSYLSDDELESQFETLGQYSKSNIIKGLSKNLNETQQLYYSQLEEWMADEKNIESLREGDISSFLESYNIEDGQKESLMQMANTLLVFYDAFDEQFSKSIKRYDNWVKNIDQKGELNLEKDTTDLIANFSNIFGPEYLVGIQDQYQAILKNTGLNASQQREQITNLTDIFSAISQIENPDIKNTVLQKIQTADLTSINGIYTFLETLANTDLDLTGDGKELQAQLIALGQKLKVNITSEIESYFSEIESTAEGFDKALSSAIGGMSLKDAKEMADKLGVELNDFTVRDGKFYYDNIEQIKKTYIKDEKARQQALRNNIEERYNSLRYFDEIYSDGTPDIFGEDILNGEYSLDDLKEENFKKDFQNEVNIDYNEFLDYYEQFLKYQEEGGTENFINYVLSLVDKDIKGSSEKLSQWLTQTQAISELKNGKFNDFLTTALSGQEVYKAADVSSKILDAAMSGDFSALQMEDAELYKIFEPYIDSLISFFKDSKSSVLNEIIGMVGTGASTSIKVTDANRDYLKKLQAKGLIGEGNLDDKNLKSIEANLSNESILWAEIIDTYENEKDRLEAFKTLHKNKYSKNKLSGLQSITDESITYDDFVDYLSNNRAFSADQIFNKGVLQREAKIYGLSMNAAGDYIVTNWSNYVTQLTNDLNYLLETGLNANKQQATIQDINAARAAVAKAQKELTTAIQTSASDLLKNYDDVSIEQQEAFANAMGVDSAQLQWLYKTGIGGKTQLDVAKFKEYSEKFSTDTQAILAEMFNQIADDYLNNITDATNYVIKGTSNQADIQKFIESAQNMNMSISSNAFSYDSILNAWTLDPTILTEYAQKQAQELVNAGLLQQEELSNYLDVNVRQSLAQQINISDFLKAENKGITGKAYQALETAFTNYISSSNELFIKLRDQHIEESIATIPEPLKQSQIDDMLQHTTAQSLSKIYIGQIKKGGARAIEIMQAVAEASGQELNASDIESAYRAEISEVENALDQILYGPGSIVSGKAVEILKQLQSEGKASITEIGDSGSAIITSMTDIAAAYAAYYDELAATGEATLAALNEAKAKVLETKNGRAEEQFAIDALGDASGMTYTAFAEIFTNAGMELTDILMEQLERDQVIEALGGNQMRIKDFTKFAQAMHWDYNSEAYISAFKSYNDGLIELNRKTEKNITEEITQLKDAKPGDWINLTEFSQTLTKTIVGKMGDSWKDASALDSLNQSLSIYGASLQNGILKIADNANLYGIAQSIQQAALDAELDLKDGFEEIADAIQSIFKSYVESIKNGINGGLSNVEVADLRQKAFDLGVTNIDFNQTKEGLKLSEQSAIGLYTALKKVDALQASLVFDDLKNSLEEADENFKSSSSLISYITTMRRQLNSADSQVSDARLSQYQAELAVAQEILAVRSTQEDNSFNFMSNDIPAAQKNPLNYAKNWTQAFQKIREAYKVKKGNKTGFIDYEDYYNIITEMNNIAGISGQTITIGKDIEGNALILDGSLERASAAIQAGCDSLTSVDTGDLKVNLGAIGLNIESGSEAMLDSVTSGIQAASKSQVKMLDGLIAMLEIIVAMEQLGDITGDDTTINLGDIFTVDGQEATEENLASIDGYTDKFEQGRKKILKYLEGNKEAETIFRNTTISLGGKQQSLYNMLNKNFEQLWGNEKVIPPQYREKAAKTFQGLINSFYQAAITGDYNLDDIAASVKDVIAKTGLKLEDFVFNIPDKEGKITRTLAFAGETVIDINYEDKDTRKAFDEYFNTNYENNEGKYRKHIQNLLAKYQKGLETDNLNLSQKINIRQKLAVASGEFSLTESKSKPGTYTGYYNGKKFVGKKDKVLDLMGEAALFKDQGMDFTIETKNGKQVRVVGKTTIGNTEVQVDYNKQGKLIYSYGGEKGSKDKIIGKLASEGKYDVGGTYSFTGKNGNKYTSTVQYDATLGLSYSIVVEKDPEGNKKEKIMYDGHKFKNYEALTKFSQFQKDFDPTKSGKWGKGNKKNIYTTSTTVQGGKLTINTEYDASTGKTTLSIGKEKFDIKNENYQQVKDYLTSSQKDNFTETTKTKNSTTRTFTYNYGNAIINGTIDLKNGTTTYEYKIGKEAGTLSSSSSDALELVMQKMSDAEVEGFKDVQTQEVTWEINGNKIKLTVNSEGQIGIDKNDPAWKNLDKKARKKVEEAINAANKKTPPTLENPVEASASSIVIKTEGAEVSADAETLTLKDPLEVKVPNSKLIITPTDTDVTGENPDESTTTIKGTIDYETGEVEKPSKDELTANGTVHWENDYTPLVVNDISKTVHWTNVNDGEPAVGATGNFGLAKGTALAQGTLMGELGPELVVSNGRYFVAGQNGAEFVNLDSDAIVFNHLQTRSLFENGMSTTRGRAVTNERKAVAFARGNIAGGPAKASAAQALAALKQLRGQWAALANLSAQDLAGKGGGGGGGGGGDPKAFIKDLERWYNWLQKIAQLEKEINLEEAKRSEYASDFGRTGKKYFTSQKDTLDYLQEQMKVQISLNDSQEEYFKKRRKELNDKGAFRALYTFDENGQLKYKDGALSWLSKLSGRDAITGKPNYTAKQQYEELVKHGYGNVMKYDSSGNEIKHEGEDWYGQAVQAFWDRIDAEKEEMQSLHDDIEEGKQKVVELEDAQNEILHEIEDNQIAVEQKVLKAVVESRQRQIDEMQEQRDAIEESANKLIDGLSENLQKEQDMYNQQTETDELQKLQRQLAILQRSGGSAAQIADVQQQIAEKQRGMYFDIQQQQIDALQQATDSQLERLDHQIDIMEQSLAYEQENGLLWNKVSEILKGSPESIAKYIQDNTKDYWGQSPTELTKTIREDLFEIDRFKEYQTLLEKGVNLFDGMYGDEVAKKQAEKEKKKREAEEKKKKAEEEKNNNNNNNNKNNNSNSNKATRWGIKKVGNEYKVFAMPGGLYATAQAAQAAANKANDAKNPAKVSEGHASLDEDRDQNKKKNNNQGKKNFTPGAPVPNKPGYVYDNQGHWVAQKKKKTKGKASGGYVGHGVYELGELGTETVLTAQQTKILRDNILSNRPDSLISLLKSYNQAYHGLSAATYDSISTNNSNNVTIERAEVNLQIEKLANDYDSKRAANTVMEEMLRIASKTSANNSVRR